MKEKGTDFWTMNKLYAANMLLMIILGIILVVFYA